MWLQWATVVKLAGDAFKQSHHCAVIVKGTEHFKIEIKHSSTKPRGVPTRPAQAQQLYFTLPSLTLPYLTLPCLALPCLTLLGAGRGGAMFLELQKL